MLVNQQNFLKESNNLIQKLPTAAFFTLNLQLTGLNIPNASRPSKFDQPCERYAQLKTSPERYSIIQLGICLFHENPDFRRHAKRIRGVISTEERISTIENINHSHEDDGDGYNDGGGDSEQIINAQNLENIMPLQNGNHGDHHNNNNNNDRVFSDDESDDASYVSSSSSEQLSDSDDDDNDGGSDGDNDGDDNNDDDNDNEPDGNGNQGDQQHDNNHHRIRPRIPHRNPDRNRNRNRNRNPRRAGARQRSEPPEFHVRKYNFFLFPSSNSSSREVVLSPASIVQMSGNGRGNGNAHDLQDEDVPQELDFNEWMKNGIPYTTLDQAEGILRQFQLDHDKHSNGNGNANGFGIGLNADNDGARNGDGSRVTEWEEPTDPSDIAFIARAMANLREWIDQAALQPSVPLSDNMSLEQEERIGIVKVIPFPKKESLRRCLRGKIEFEYPSLHWDENDNQQVVVRLNDDEKKIRDARRKKFAWQKMHEEKIGFTRVFKALSDACRGELGQIGDFDSEYLHFCSKFEDNADDSASASVLASTGGITPVSGADLTKQACLKQRRVPMVLHNGFMDFLFLLTHFQRHKLPPTYEEAKKMLHRYFPLVYDTQILASEFSDNAVRTRQTGAHQLYRRFVRGRADDTFEEQNDLAGRRIPRSLVVNGTTHSYPSPEARDNPDLNPGDNAFMIGTIFQCLCRRIKWKTLEAFDTENREKQFFTQIVLARQSRVGSLLFLDERLPESKLCAPLYGLNKVFLHQSIFTVDMEAIHDPLKPGYTMSAIFKVMHPNKAVALNEINGIIKGIRDPVIVGRHAQQKIHYEIGLTSKWFIVAARNKIPRGMDANDPATAAIVASTLERRATLLFDALSSNFSDCEITSLEDAVLSSTAGWSSLKRKKKRSRRQSEQGEANVENNGILSKVFGAFRFGSYKRRRVE